jgi:hypothetical protein
MSQHSLKKYLFLCLFLLLPILFLGQQLLRPEATARGKSAAIPLSDEQTPEQQLAEALALADSRVQAHTVGRRSEVFGVRTVGSHYTAASAACANADCRQVEIYNFDDDAAVIAIVNVESRQVLDVLHQPGVHPGINKRLSDRALEIATNHPDVIAALGYRPAAADLAPVDAGLIDSVCSQGHLCVAPNFRDGDFNVWAIVDLTDEQLVAVDRMAIGDNEEAASSIPFMPGGCPQPGTVTRDGWDMDYQTTGTDGLRVYDVTYNGVPVITSVKAVEWHADYGSSGYEDTPGCGGGGGGFPIYPYGETEVLDIEDGQSNVIGFEVVQDFRMGNWGGTCNYRYDQHIQFFMDGRFRVVSGAYGKGCGTNSLYRPIVRIDIAVDGPTGDSFALWNGSAWETQTNEGWWSQAEPYTDEGYKWRVSDEGGAGYYMEPGQGQFGDGGEGDNAFIYAVLHKANEGDSDLGVIGDCCNDDYQQGPHIYLNNEGIENQDLVIWYVPQMLTDATGPDYYCWTVSGEPNPETYPCYGGPMFVPIDEESAPTAAFTHQQIAEIGEAVSFTNTTSGSEPISYTWDFGDGVGTSNETDPTYQYAAAGTYTVSLTAENSFGSSTYASTIMVVEEYEIVQPNAAATLVYTDTAGHVTTIGIPAGAVSGTTTIVFTGLENPVPPKFHLFGGIAFSLDAYQDGVLLPGFVFNEPLGVTLEYIDEDVAGIVEETLALYFWNGSVWVDASTTCDPASTYERNVDENWLSVDICHLTDFGLFGESILPLNYFYMPSVVNE